MTEEEKAIAKPIEKARENGLTTSAVPLRTLTPYRAKKKVREKKTKTFFFLLKRETNFFLKKKGKGRIGVTDIGITKTLFCLRSFNEGKPLTALKCKT